MLHFPRFFCKHISRFWTDELLFQSKAPVFLPFYHTVNKQPLEYIANYPIVDEKQFEDQLDYYLKYFHPVSLEELYTKQQAAKKVFHLSFDDGLRQCSEVIAPILLRKGIPATFFINSGFVDNKDLFHRFKAGLVLSEMKKHPDVEAEALLAQHGINLKDILQTPFKKREVLDEAIELLEFDIGTFLQREKPYLSTQEIQDLSKKGFSIGGHSHKHPEFWKISEKKQLKHARKSMRWVDRNIEQKVRAFAFPYTDYGVSANLIRQLKEENICDISFGTAGIKYDSIDSHFQRYPAEEEGNLKTRLKGEFVYFKLRKLLGKAIVKH